MCIIVHKFMALFYDIKLLSMISRKIHRTIGLILLLPMLGWAITGVIFFIKPGYKEAYGQLPLKKYPIEKSLIISPKNKWEEVKLSKTILGHHLLVKVDGIVKHLDPATLQEKAPPSSLQYKRLIEDAVSTNKERYGEVVTVSNNNALTSTGVEIKLDWLNLALKQKGNDTKLIDFLYKIHYLQWTPSTLINQFFGAIGLLLLIILTLCGFKIYITNRR